MIFGKTTKQKEEIAGKYYRWFAWYPVQLLNGCWAWWQIVQRRIYKNLCNKERREYKP